MTMQPKSKIIIVDDHKMFLDGLRSILEPQPHLEIVMTAKNGQNQNQHLFLALIERWGHLFQKMALVFIILLTDRSMKLTQSEIVLTYGC